MKTFFEMCSVEHWVQINQYLGVGEEGKEKLFKAKERSHILFYMLFSQILAQGRPTKDVQQVCVE